MQYFDLPASGSESLQLGEEATANQKLSAIPWHGFSQSKFIIMSFLIIDKQQPMVDTYCKDSRRDSIFIQSVSRDWIKKEVTL